MANTSEKAVRHLYEAIKARYPAAERIFVWIDAKDGKVKARYHIGNIPVKVKLEDFKPLVAVVDGGDDSAA